MRAFVEKFWQRLLFRSTNCYRLAIDYFCHVRFRVVQVAYQNRLRWAHDHTGGLQADIDPMRAEVTLFGRVIFRVNEDRIVRAGGHARLAANANRFVEINNTVRALKHGSGGAGGDARRVCALIAARYLMRAAGLRKDADVDMLHIRTRY